MGKPGGGVSDSPRIETAEMGQTLRHEVEQRGRPECAHIEVGVHVDEAHAFRHELFEPVGPAQRVQLLSPVVDLAAGVHLGWAHVVAAQAEAARRHVVAVAGRILQHAQVHPDGAGYEIGVAVASAAPVDGACVHAGSAADALQGFPMLGIAKDVAAPVVHQHHVHFPTGACLAEV